MLGTRTLRRTLAFLGAWAVLLTGFLSIARPRYRTWGATAQEIERQLPGDRIAPAHATQETRAITIRAPIDQAWPWLAQIGQYRGGFYSFDQLENAVGCEMPTVDVLTPAHQVWQVGDSLWMYGRDKANGVGFAVLRKLVPGRALAFSTTATGSPKGQVDGSWTFVMEPLDAGTTRFLIRGRGPADRSVAWATFDRLIFEPMHFVMERRTMLGIKQLAEGGVRGRTENTILIVLWGITFAFFIAAGVAVFRSARIGRALAAFIAAGVTFQILTLGQPNPLVGALLVIALGAAGWSASRFDRRRLVIHGIALQSRSPRLSMPGAPDGRGVAR